MNAPVSNLHARRSLFCLVHSCARPGRSDARVASLRVVLITIWLASACLLAACVKVPPPASVPPLAPPPTSVHASMLPASASAASIRTENPLEVTQKLVIQGKAANAALTVAFSAKGNIVAAGYDDGSIELYDVATGGIVGQFWPLIGMVNSLVFSPDGSMLAAGGGQELPGLHGVRVWSLATKGLLLRLDDFDGPVFGVAFSPDSLLLAAAWGQTWNFGPGSVKVWKATTGELADELRLPDRFKPSTTVTCYGSVFSPDGTRLAAAYADGRTVVWNVSRQQQQAVLTGRQGHRYSAALAPDGTILATAGDANAVDATADLALWDAATGAQLTVLEGHRAAVRSIVFSPDGRVLASASPDGTVRLWDVGTAKGLAVLEIPGATTVAFSPDGRLLATGGWRDPVRLWAVQRRERK